MKPLKVLFLCSEAAPLIKVGGLGDVAGSLPPALRALPEKPDIRVCLPLYPAIKNLDLDLIPTASFELVHSSGPVLAEIYQGVVNRVPFYFIDGSLIASSRTVYSGDNYQDGLKFTFFSLAAMELARNIGWKPDIVHAQDWHTAPAVYNLHRVRKKDDFFLGTRSLLTVHNLPYLGQGAEPALAEFGLPAARGSALPEWTSRLPLPLGLLTADKINTVSPGYAREILTAEFGAGLEKFLMTRREDLSGILNGLDLESWDPENDPELPFNYSAAELKDRAKNKTQLQEEIGLERDPHQPLLAMVNRMDAQKGVDLVPDALRALCNHDWQAVILGTGDPELERSAKQLANDRPQVAAILKYDDSLARRIYAGSDIMLIPSRYEPCGLTQMIGMRYGCVPLARATGGLKDTIIDYHSSHREESTGFLFNQAAPRPLAKAVLRALDVYKDQRRWRGLQRRGMKADFSWEKSASKYLDLYNELSELELKIENL